MPSTFRADALAFTFSALPENQQIRLAIAADDASNAAANAATATDENTTAAVYATAAAASATVYAIYPDDARVKTVADAADAATYAISTSASEIAALFADLRFIDDDRTAQDLASLPLWPNGQMPDDFAKYWEELKSQLLSRGEAWDVWTNWYEDRLMGRPPEDEALASARVTLPEPMWREGPKLVNWTINELSAIYNKDGPEAIEARIAELRRQYPDQEIRDRHDNTLQDRHGNTLLIHDAEPQASTAPTSATSHSIPGDVEDIHYSTFPNAWILQFTPNDWVARWTAEAVPGSTLRWKSGKALQTKMRAGDPVIYWRAIDPDNRNDRGGLVGLGTILSTETEDEDGILRFPTEVRYFDNNNPLPRDQVIDGAGITRRNWRGAVLSLKSEEVARLRDYLREQDWPELLPEESDNSLGNNPYDPDAPEPVQPRITETHDTDFVSDRPETAKDLLNRASLAFALAAHVNRIWASQTSGQGDKSRLRKVLDWLHFERFNRRTKEPDDAAFILHIDAPWGGGKTTFANFLARILNPVGHGDDPDDKEKTKKTLLDGLPLKDPRYWDPEFSKRRWFVIDFNAWQNEHVSPPWWNFYGTIRRQCLRETLFEPGRYSGVMPWRGLQRAFAWCRFQITEIIWRVATPEMARTLLVLAVVAGLIYWASGTEWYRNLSTPPPSSGSGNGGPNQYVPLIKALLGVAATGGAGLAVINAFKSGVKTIVESAGKSANASSLGVADPIQKFRRHFSWFTEQLGDPVMVIVDDLDRCSPKYVVELVRGLLTIFRSPRVVFVLLGDKDWIETAFAKVYKEMADVHKDTQVTFGGRFAEKAIQLSFVLPEADEDTREAYLTEILQAGKDAQVPEEREQVQELKEIQKEIRDELASADKIAEQSAAVQRSQTRIEERISKAAPEKQEDLRKATQSILNRESMLRAATARSAEAEIRRHGLSPLKDYLPGNPRRIKRIVNMVGAYQASAQSTNGVALGSDKWKQMVIWVVIMSEYPQVWHQLVKNDMLSATLFEAIENSGTEKTIELPLLDDEASDEQKAIAALLKIPGLVPLLRGDPFATKKGVPSPARIDTTARNWLRRLTPIE
ncbi:P-loop NTPase fold protein [uncultured Roseibium sp.]|uniref:P-loop NTPase fold protein n=1 Tax=uncultured Roseibium sp. TaxID=1936171 RepID=UPI0032171023